MTISIGADPEFFLYDPQAEDEELQDGDDSRDLPQPSAPPGYVPCVGLIPGTKEQPHQLHGPPGYFCHEDNVCLEVGFPPTNNPRQFVESIGLVKNLVQDEFLNPLHYDLSVIPVVEFKSNQLRSPQAQIAGCEPDYNAYTSGKVRTISSDFMASNARYAGGHIHLGGDFNCPPFIVALFADIWLTLQFLGDTPGTMYSKQWQQRVQWYGQPGIFRTKPYGIEYRTPDNWWCRGPRPARQMANAAVRLCHFLEDTSATRLREMVQKIDWLALQSFLSMPPRQNIERIDKQQILWHNCMAHVGGPEL